MGWVRTKRRVADSGQSLIETALVLPILITLVLNAVNIGYFFMVAVNMSGAVRHAAIYSTQGGQTQTTPVIPLAGPPTNATTVSYLVYSSFSGAMSTGGAAHVRVCSKRNGISGSGSAQISTCTYYSSSSDAGAGGSGTFTTTVAADNRAPLFVLHRVDIEYTVNPLFSGTAFNLVLPASLTFRRQVSMRAID